MVEITMELELRAGSGSKTFRDAAKGLAAISKNAINFTNLDPVIRRNMTLFLKGIALQMSQRHGKAWPGGTTSNTLSKRSGALIASINQSIKVTGKFTSGGDIRGQIGSPLTYASTQEFGATIHGKNSKKKLLTIPLPAALNKNGTMKLPKARDYPRTFVAKSRRGNLLIFQKIGKRKIVPLFVLKKSVKIPARLNMGVAIEGGSRALGDIIIEQTLREFQLGKI